MNLVAARNAFDGNPPPFVLKGAWLTAAGGPVIFAKLAQDGREPLEEAEKPASEAPRPGESASGLDISSPRSDPEREAENERLAGVLEDAKQGIGVGARLTREVKALLLGRNLPLRDWPAMALAPPSAGPQLLKGVASEVKIDLEHCMLMPNALRWKELPPLRLRHGACSVGEIIDLKYLGLGSTLQITCRVDDPEAARMPAFSIGFTPLSYELVDRGGPSFHFRVDSARLIEVSLTERPCLRSATVTARAPASPPIADPRYRALQNEMARLRLVLAA